MFTYVCCLFLISTGSIVDRKELIRGYFRFFIARIFLISLSFTAAGWCCCNIFNTVFWCSTLMSISRSDIVITTNRTAVYLDGSVGNRSFGIFGSFKFNVSESSAHVCLPIPCNFHWSNFSFIEGIADFWIGNVIRKILHKYCFTICGLICGSFRGFVINASFNVSENSCFFSLIVWVLFWRYQPNQTQRVHNLVIYRFCSSETSGFLVCFWFCWR